MTIREKLVKRTSKSGIHVPSEALDGLIEYFELLRKWNRKVSLTALPVEDAGEEAIDRLLIEPVLASRLLPKPDAIVLDIGSGGGSPAIPMKLMSPGMSLRMVESKTQTAFLREVVRTLKLPQAEVDAVRFEELLVRPSLHDTFDVVTMRAVRLNRKLLMQVQTFVRPGGSLMLFGTATSKTGEVAAPFFTLASRHLLLNQWGSSVDVYTKDAPQR